MAGPQHRLDLAMVFWPHFERDIDLRGVDLADNGTLKLYEDNPVLKKLEWRENSLSVLSGVYL